MDFIKNCWEVVGEDIIGFIQEFHKSAKLPKEMISYFVTLIPKSDNPQGFEDYRPICIIDCMY